MNATDHGEPDMAIEHTRHDCNIRTEVLWHRCLGKDEQGNVIETPKQMFRRVADVVAAAESKYGATPWQVEAVADAFYRLMVEGPFLPSSPTLFNAGMRLAQFAACYVLPVEDSLEAIYTVLKDAAIVNKSGGGTGFSFSRLRPQGDVVGSTGGVTSGPISFMRVYDASLNEVKQGGRRRGAGMAILHDTHPDILNFIGAKSQPGVLENFNLSVAVSSDFMRRALAGEDYDLINPRTGKTTGRLNAREVLNKIARAAWATGEPGLCFIDTVNKYNPTPHIGAIETVDNSKSNHRFHRLHGKRPET